MYKKDVKTITCEQGIVKVVNISMLSGNKPDTGTCVHMVYMHSSMSIKVYHIVKWL